jgi:RNA polymerase sigma-70 factor (ECF subfamily)
MSAPQAHQERFRHVYAEHFDRVLGYALRRVGRPEDAADVVAETFLVAWRRLRDVPHEPATRLWLYGVARRVLANQRRGERRRTALGQRLAADLALAVPDPAPAVAERLRYDHALERRASCGPATTTRATRSTPARYGTQSVPDGLDMRRSS